MTTDVLFCNEKLNIRRAYTDTNVFLTGATGFIGMGVLEKLLYDTDVSKIFVLVRPRCKSGAAQADRKKSVAGRVERIVENDRFERLKLREEDNFNQYISDKVIPIPGDLMADGLAISDEDRATLVQELHGGVVIHCAADVNFFRPVNEAMRVNIQGSVEILKLANEAGAVGFVHTSTLYANVRENKRSRVMEVFYPLGFNAMDMYEEWLDKKKKLDEESVNYYWTQRCTNQGGWPNTYTFTKAVAERVMESHAKEMRMRLSIVRLGIVCNSAKDTPGWSNAAGQAFEQITVATAMRLITILPGDGSAVPDTVPVDHTVNGLITSGARFMAQHRRNVPVQPVEIYQIGICDYLTNYELGRSFEAWSSSLLPSDKEAPEVPCLEVESPSTQRSKVQQRKAWNLAGTNHFRVKFIPNERWFWIEFYIRYDLPYFVLWPLSHFLPSISKTVYLLSKGRRKLAKFLTNYDFFLKGAWIFDTTNTRKLYQTLDQSSRDRFDFDGENFDMMSYQVFSANCCVLKFKAENERKKTANLGKRNKELEKFKENRKRLISLLALIIPILSLLFYTFMLAMTPVAAVE